MEAGARQAPVPRAVSVLRTGRERYIPIVGWLPAYRREYLAGDLMAGLVVAIMLVPQAMAYAMLAGLPPEVGLYASIVPMAIYAALGTSRFLSVGPVAMDSLLVAAALGAIATAGSADYVGLALLLALIVGAIQLAMGLGRLGFLVNFLSQPVISGFTSAAALVIGLSQLKHLLGMTVVPGGRPYEALAHNLEAIATSNPATAAIGIASIALLLACTRWLGALLEKRGVRAGVAEPIARGGPLVAVVASALAVWAFALDTSAGVKVVGEIPAGFPPLTMPRLDVERVVALFPAAAVIAIVALTEAISTATALASKRRQKIDSNQELVALGAANLGAAFTGGYPVTGGLSRSVVNFAAGANTTLASLVTASLIAVTVVFLMPLFYYLPQATLAAIIVVAVARLVDLRAVRHVWRYNKADALSLLATFAGVLVFDIAAGIGIGVAVSILLYLWRTSRPHVAVVGRVGDTEHFRNVLRHHVTTCPKVLAIRIDESLYFANAKYLETTLLRAVADHPEIEHLLLICSGTNFVDASALETLERLVSELRDAGVELMLAEVKGPVMDRLERIGFVERLGRERVFLSTHDAMCALGCGDLHHQTIEPRAEDRADPAA